MDKYLKFSSKEEAESVLFDKVGDALIPKLAFVADVVGVIYAQTGVVVESSEGPIFETAPLPGWHVNLRGPDADKFCQYEVSVKSPTRSWA